MRLFSTPKTSPELVRHAIVDDNNVDVKDLLDILHLSPDYDILSRKNALNHLGADMAQNPCDCERFFKFNGLEIILDLMEKCLDETKNMIELLPEVIKVLKVLAMLTVIEFLSKYSFVLREKGKN